MNNKASHQSPANATALAAAARRGNRAALAQLCEMFYPRVFARTITLTHNYHDAENLAQEVMLLIAQRIKTLREPAAISSWIYQITTRRCLNFRRSSKQKQVARFNSAADSDFSANLPSQETPQEVCIRKEQSRAVRRSISLLANPCKETASDFYLSGKSIREIATYRAIPVGTVKSRLFMARQRLKEILS